MKQLTHLSLFTGIGGIDLAAEAAGFATVCQCEWADYPTAVLERHWPDVPRFKDIHTLTKEAFYERTGQKEVTLLSGGFPCQPFSSLGQRKGFADSRYLWPEMCRVIKELRPHYVLGENVAHFIHMGLSKTVADLEASGYAVQTFVLPACAVGAWHERRRTFIVGVDVSHAPCVGHRREGTCVKSGDDTEGSVPATHRRREILDGKPAGSSIFPGTGNRPGYAAQPGMGGVDDGIPPGMDGKTIWRIEPPGIPRLCRTVENHAQRMKALGNAVVPAQAYPILKYIADMETGKCAKQCVWQSGAAD